MIATAKMTEPSPSPNQMMPSKVQPMPGKALTNGVSRPSIARRNALT